MGANDIRLGDVAGDVPAYIRWPQFDAWRHTRLILDVVPGRGGLFSLDNGCERRFLTISRLFSKEELAALEEENGSPNDFCLDDD